MVSAVASVIHTDDQLVSMRQSAYLYKHIPKAEYRVWKSGGHALPLQFPEEMNKSIRDWVSRSTVV